MNSSFEQTAKVLDLKGPTYFLIDISYLNSKIVFL